VVHVDRRTAVPGGKDPEYERLRRTCQRGKGVGDTCSACSSLKKKSVLVLFRDAEFNLRVPPHEQRIERQHVVCQVQYLWLQNTFLYYSLQNNSYFLRPKYLLHFFYQL
jgi:hypothetical protein